MSGGGRREGDRRSRAPRWARWLLGRVAAPGRVDEVVGDLEEAHRDRVGRRGRLPASVLTGLEALDVAVALLRDRRGGGRARRESVRSKLRAGGRSRTLGISWLDVKLGARMLVKHPGVTVVGGLAMMIGIGLGAAYLEIVNDFLHPTLPLDEGERIVGLQNRDLEENDPDLRSIHDFVGWREELESVRNLGAFRSIEQNLGMAEGPAEPAQGVEITPAAFDVVRVPALLGRTLIDADERAGAPSVVVLGYELWRNRFSGDPGVVGRTVRLGNSTSTVVGVMPEGFAFPVNHRFWVPLRPDALAYGRRQGPPIQIFGRLAPGVTLEEAQAELSALGRRAAADFPATHERLRPRVVKYTELFIDGEDGGQAYLAEVIFVLLLLVLSSNVATMVFARTATRENEIAMRSALGASRGRIVAQLFVEAFVLALAATVVGLTVVARGTTWFTRFFWEVTEGRVPFWLDSGLSLNATTVLYAVSLAVLGALVAGALPALKATGSRQQTRLRHPAGGGGSALRFGGLWSGMIVVQVALAVLVVPPAIVAISALAEADHVDPGFAAEEYLSARLEMDRERPPADSAARADFFSEFQAARQELRRRLLAEPGISRVTFATRLPGMNHPQPLTDVDSGGGAPGATAELVTTASVDASFFDAFGAEIVAGRGFDFGDLDSDRRVVVVNEHFVTEILQGRNAIGRRVRARGREPGPWYEIVGVVSNLGMDTYRDPFWPGKGPGLYHPLTRNVMASGGSYSVRMDPGALSRGPRGRGAGDSYSVRMAFHVRGDAASFAPRLREVAHAVHPALRLHDILPLDRPVDWVNRGQRRVARFSSWITALVALIALLISVAGTYSVMSFTVSRRTREIGIRVALGADRRHIITGAFSRAMLQIGTGIVVGALLWFYLLVYRLGEADQVGLLLTTALILTLVGLVACGVPVRRALRIQPTEALRDLG